MPLFADRHEYGICARWRTANSTVTPEYYLILHVKEREEQAAMHYR